MFKSNCMSISLSVCQQTVCGGREVGQWAKFSSELLGWTGTGKRWQQKSWWNRLFCWKKESPKQEERKPVGETGQPSFQQTVQGNSHTGSQGQLSQGPAADFTFKHSLNKQSQEKTSESLWAKKTRSMLPFLPFLPSFLSASLLGKGSIWCQESIWAPHTSSTYPRPNFGLELYTLLLFNLIPATRIYETRAESKVCKLCRTLS